MTILAAFCSGAWVCYLRAKQPDAPSDLMPVIWGAQAWLRGENPFDVVARSTVWNGGLLYPFTAVAVLAPFAWVPPFALNVVWVSVSAAALAWMVTRRGLTPQVVMLFSPAMIHAANTSQWTPLLTAATLTCWGGPLLACKPTTAVWLFAYRPRWSHVVGGGVLLGLTFMWWPGWVLAWREVLGKAIYTIWPMALPGAPLVLIAALYWRRPEARLLTTMALVPHTMLIYETLPLFLIPATWVEAGVLWTGSLLVTGLHRQFGPYADATAWVRMSGQLIVLAVYLPALVMIVRAGARERQRRRVNTRAFNAFSV